jgi:hypothetical protein
VDAGLSASVQPQQHAPPAVSELAATVESLSIDSPHASSSDAGALALLSSISAPEEPSLSTSCASDLQSVQQTPAPASDFSNSGKTVSEASHESSAVLVVGGDDGCSGEASSKSLPIEHTQDDLGPVARRQSLTSEASHESSAVLVVGGDDGGSGEASAKSLPIEQTQDDLGPVARRQSLDDRQFFAGQLTEELSADVEVLGPFPFSHLNETFFVQDCVADEAYDSDAEVEQIVADVKSGKRVSTLEKLCLPPILMCFEFQFA